METILMLVAPFPIGFFIKNRLAAYVVYLALHGFVFTYQSMDLVIEWVGHSTSAFGPYPHASNTETLSYLLVNTVIALAGLGLVTLGLRLGARRRARQTSGINLDPVS